MPAPKQRIRFCTSADKARLAYAATGEGPPLIKAANWLTHLTIDWESPVWKNCLLELSKSHTLVRYDARGCGLSDRNVDFSFEAWIEDLEAVVNAAGYRRFPLLALCAGVPVAIAYAARHPERVSHLILHGGAVLGNSHRQASPQQRELDEAAIRMIELGWSKENPAFRQLFTSQLMPEATLSQQRSFNDLQRLSTSPESAARSLRLLYDVDVREEARAISCPTLVLHPTGDTFVPFEQGRLIASLVPGARFVPLESRNHILLENEPAWRRWFDEVRTFLRSECDSSGVFAELSPRETDILELIAQGSDNGQIARRLALSEKTVRNHITNIFSKLGVANRSQAIVLSRDHGFGQKSRV